MQDRYVGDVGDFAKYGLLRILNAQAQLRLAVIWYLFGDESHNLDGRHVSYLGRSDFAGLDPALHATLDRLVRQRKRSIRAVQGTDILPSDTIFFASRVSDATGISMNRRTRAAIRLSWHRRAVAKSAEAELVFFDPDNGLETASVPRHSPKSGKYVYWDELLPFWHRGQSLVVYHHLNRTAPVVRQTELLRDLFNDRFPDAGAIKGFLFRRGSCRHFWLVVQKRHEDRVQRALQHLLQSDWRLYFEVS